MLRTEVNRPGFCGPLYGVLDSELDDASPLLPPDDAPPRTPPSGCGEVRGYTAMVWAMVTGVSLVGAGLVLAGASAMCRRPPQPSRPPGANVSLPMSDLTV
jgi:hypothetical protein